MTQGSFSITPTHDNLFRVEISGKLDATSMGLALDRFLEELGPVRHAGVLCIYRDVELPTAGAMGVDLKRVPQIVSILRHIDKLAVISGQEWVRATARAEAPLVPGVETRVFEPGQEAEAIEFLTVSPDLVVPAD